MSQGLVKNISFFLQQTWLEILPKVSLKKKKKKKSTGVILRNVYTHARTVAALSQVINMQLNSTCFVEMSTWYVAYDTYSGFADTVTANIWSWRQSWFSSTVHLLGLQSYSATETRLFTSSSKRPSSTAPYGVLTIGFFQSACRLALEMADEKKSSSPFCSSHEGKMKAVKNTFFFLLLTFWEKGQVIQWHFAIQVWGRTFLRRRSHLSQQVQSSFCSEIAQRNLPPHYTCCIRVSKWRFFWTNTKLTECC